MTVMAAHLYTVLLCCLVVLACGLKHSLCTTSALSVRGRDVVQASRGSVLVAVFMPLQCATCHRQLKRLSYMASTLGDVRVVVLAPSYEAPVTISRIQNEFPRLVIDRDVDGVWRAYEASNHDQIVFDRCSRVAHVLSHPRSDMASYRDTLDAIDSARDHAPCGSCQHDSTSRDEANAGEREKHKSVDAFVGMSAKQQQQQQQQRQQQQPQQQQLEGRPYEEYRRSNSRPTLNVRANYNQQRPQQDYDRQQQVVQMRAQQLQNHASAQYYQTTSTTPATAAYLNRNRQQNVNYQHQGHYRTPDTVNVLRGQDENNHLRQPIVDPRQNQPQFSRPYPSRTIPSTTSRPNYESQPGYGPDEDYEDDALLSVMTTPSLQTQIPSPTPFDPLWPTPAPGQYFRSDPRNPKRVQDPRFTKFGELASENNIPCSAYTDDICFQQQEKLGHESVSKCCKKGIYLTDVCMPGKCSNHTIQLCCFQKFLQARYACCEDDEQSLGPASTNQFSMCCYNNFVNEDECCGRDTAANYWRSTHEVCFPNIKVDYSKIKMEVRFAEGVRVVDMNENRVWDYECRNGMNRTQYAYVP